MDGGDRCGCSPVTDDMVRSDVMSHTQEPNHWLGRSSKQGPNGDAHNEMLKMAD